VSDKAASKGSEEDGENDRGLLKSFLLLRTVVPASCNMGERVLQPMQVLSEAVNTQAKKRGRESQTTTRNKDAKAQEHDK